MAFVKASALPKKPFDVREYTERRIKQASEKGFNSTRVWMDAEKFEEVSAELEQAGYGVMTLEQDDNTGRFNVEVSW